MTLSLFTTNSQRQLLLTPRGRGGTSARLAALLHRLLGWRRNRRRPPGRTSRHPFLVDYLRSFNAPRRAVFHALGSGAHQAPAK